MQICCDLIFHVYLYTVIVFVIQVITSNVIVIVFVIQVVGTPCYISPELCEGKPHPLYLTFHFFLQS